MARSLTLPSGRDVIDGILDIDVFAFHTCFVSKTEKNTEKPKCADDGQSNCRQCFAAKKQTMKQL